MDRQVVLICGPPGAGKTTYARSLGLTVYDLDDPQWVASDRLFRDALKKLAGDPLAQAAVIRAGATQESRAKAASLVGATEVRLLATDRDECVRRVISRGRERPPMRMQIAAVEKWWSVHEADEAAQLGETSRRW